ncbi:MAG: serine/threonine protein kinase [Candidatus Obscuribacterales bacterium]|nr:serine/threonine protein kinase [Candidatus Obscuribacterales bacterium]
MSGDETEWIAEKTVSLGAAGFSQDAAVMNAAEEEEDLTGKILCDKFELTAFLGSGGMSEVYKARHIVTGKIVAVKILHQKLAKEENTSKRLKQEAQAAGALTHSSILSVHDFGVDSAGTPFLVMDFLDGVSLSDILKKEGPLPLDRFLTIIQQVASALAHAQQQNVVHRDLKPSNIMILKEGKDRAKIVDFGIAKLVDPNNEASQRLTQTGELFGSPLYMSPEQCTGAPVDPRSDIYALGCVMFEALSGKTPHMGETVFDTIHRHINSSPPPLIAAQLEPQVRDRLEGIILKCLAKNPADRYQSAASIEAELRKIELSEASGIISRIGSAWSLAQAKYLAKRKNNVPLLVISLFSVSALSVIASIILLFSLIDYNESVSIR